MSSEVSVNFTTISTIWTEEHFGNIPEEDTGDTRFLLAPLVVLITVMILSAMVYLMARNKRRITSFYKRVYVPAFSFESSDLDETEDPTECLLRGKLHIDNTMGHYQTDEKRELYT